MSRSSARTTGTTYHHGDLAASLEDAADALLAERGSSALSLREVARRAGVSHNAPYHHFADRHALLARLGERHMARLLDAQKTAVASADEDQSAVVAATSAYVGYAAEHPHGFALIFDPEVCEPGNPGAVMADLIAQNEALIEDAIGQANPELSAEQRELAGTGAWGVAHGLAQLVAAGHVPVEPTSAAIEALIALGRTGS